MAEPVGVTLGVAVSSYPRYATWGQTLRLYFVTPERSDPVAPLGLTRTPRLFSSREEVLDAGDAFFEVSVSKCVTKTQEPARAESLARNRRDLGLLQN